MHPRTGQLIPIDLPEICAPRAALMDTYKNAAGKRCVYVHAPAGSGKTVSTLLWLKKSGRRTIWIGLDRYDNAPAAFYRVFLSALAAFFPQGEDLTALIRGPAFGASPIEFTVEALARFSLSEEPCALVFDDFHLITNEEVLKSFYYVMKRLPLSFLVMVLSRSAPPEAFSPYGTNGQIALIQRADLAFRSEEIRRHFASFGHFLTVKEAEDACAATEGWAIAVSALAIGGSAYAGEASTQNPLRKYIAAQIWDKLDGDLRRFMMQTAVVDKFSEALCQSVTQNPRSRQILRALLGENLFLSHQEGAFRYHPLFLDFLREELAKEGSLEQRELHRRAAAYYVGAEDDRNALYHFIQCGDAQGIAGALGRFLSTHVESSSDMSGIAYLNRLPSRVLAQNPCLHVSCAWCAFFFGEAQEVFFHLDRVYARMGEILGANSAFFQPVLLLCINDPRYPFTAQLDRLRSLRPPFGTGGESAPKILRHKLPYFLRIYRDFTQYALNMDARFAEFRAVFAPLFKQHYAVLEPGMRSWLLYNQNRLREALSLVTGDPVPDSLELIFLSRLQIATCLHAAGQEEEAALYRRELAALVQSEKLLHLLPILTAYETKLKLQDGDRAAAGAWFTHYFVDPQPQFYKLFMHATTVRAHMVLGEYAQAEVLCGKLRGLSAGYGRVLDVAEADVLRAILLWLTGRREAALALLQETLWAMQPYGYIRVFADEGRALLPLLRQATKALDKAPVPDAAKRAFLREVYLAAYAQSKRHRGIAAAGQKPVKLSAQQRRVLELLAKGCKNADIVDLTGLSINTIRYHTKMAYQKLEVTSAIDAVLRARELKLIE
ncbi:MAG: hypothetical protein GXX99_04260 [Clostridiales bacterium]|nr:hypothetical protein [Clostridiales bacterium]